MTAWTPTEVIAVMGALGALVAGIFSAMASYRAGIARQIGIETALVASATQVKVVELEKNTNSLTERLQNEARAAGKAEGIISASPTIAAPPVDALALELAEMKAREVLAKAVLEAEALKLAAARSEKKA